MKKIFINLTLAFLVFGIMLEVTAYDLKNEIKLGKPGALEEVGEFEREHIEEIRALIDGAKKYWPNSYDMQISIVEDGIKKMKEMEKIEKNTVINNETLRRN